MIDEPAECMTVKSSQGGIERESDKNEYELKEKGDQKNTLAEQNGRESKYWLHKTLVPLRE